MKPIPPDAAFAIDNVVDSRVRAALAEARRIRDTWQHALDAACDAARVDARAACAAELRDQIDAIEHHRQQNAKLMAQAAARQARRLASRLVEHALTDTDIQSDWIATAIRSGQWTHVRVPYPLPDPPAGVTIEIDPALLPGEVILTGPGGVVDARYAARIARLTS